MRTLDVDAECVRLLLWLCDRGGPGNFHPILEFVQERDLPEMAASVLAERIKREGLAMTAPSALSPNNVDARLIAAGEERVRQILTDQNSPSKRFRELQRQMLHWLYRQSIDVVQTESWKFFVSDEPSHLGGTPFTMSEVAAAAEDLIERGMITGSRAMPKLARPGAFNPRLTARGRDCVMDHDGSVSSFMTHGGGRSGDIVYNNGPTIMGDVKGGAQLAWNMQSAVQNSQQHVEQIAPGFEAIAEAVADLMARLPQSGLSEEDQQDATEHAQVVLGEVVTAEPDRGKIKRALTYLRGVLTTLSTSAVTGAAAGVEDGSQSWITTAMENLQLPPM